jgi:hypothetical protein
MGSIKNNLKISKILLTFFVLSFLISLIFFYLYPYNPVINKWVDITLMAVSVSIALIVYFGNQRDLHNHKVEENLKTKN